VIGCTALSSALTGCDALDSFPRTSASDAEKFLEQ
jgi:hypothetical protein